MIELLNLPREFTRNCTSMAPLATAYIMFMYQPVYAVLSQPRDHESISFSGTWNGLHFTTTVYKYYHFYSVCFGLGWGAALYRPFCSPVIPSVFGVFFTIVFEILGILSELPAHTKRCKGPPYCRGDVYWGFGFALFVAILNLNSYHVYTMSYGCGIIMFALRGAKRKYSYLRKLRKRKCK